MKAVEFVKKFGWDEAKRVLINTPFGYPEIVVDDEGVSYGVGLTPLVGGLHFTYEELKQLVDAWELAKAYKDTPRWCLMPIVLEAIQLVESVNA